MVMDLSEFREFFDSFDGKGLDYLNSEDHIKFMVKVNKILSDSTLLEVVCAYQDELREQENGSSD